MLSAIQRNSGKRFSNRTVQLYRIVGLLHDIGHYPFSHATEHLVKAYYARGIIANGSNQLSLIEADTPGNEDNVPLSFEHEELGEAIIREDAELKSIFLKHGIDGNEVADIFAGKKPNGLYGIISSDLDCDRLDYLRRTAHFSGAPYGSVDIDFIIDQSTLDDLGRFCLLPKALRAADHLLISRYYDYMQVPYNKTVAALEWSLTTSLEALLNRGLMDCSGRGVLNRIRTGSWFEFDDQDIFEKFKALHNEVSSSSNPKDLALRDHLVGILRRNPPKTVASWEEIISKTDKRTSAHIAKLVSIGVREIVSQLGVDEDRLHIWNSPLQLSKVGPDEDAGDDRIAEAIYVLNPRTKLGKVLNYHKETLLHLLSSQRYVGIRLYYLPENGEDSADLVAQMREIIADIIEPTS